MRIDKYIWAIRIFKTRSMATKACNSDKVKLNGEPVKPSKLIKQNDIISIKVVPIWKSFKIIDLPKSRIGPKLVSDYTIETTTKTALIPPINPLQHQKPMILLRTKDAKDINSTKF